MPMLCAYPSPSWKAVMGLIRRSVPAKHAKTKQAITSTSFQSLPEKLPIDQKVRLTISSSSAKVMIRSVTAEQI